MSTDKTDAAPAMSDEQLIAMAGDHGSTWPDADECDLSRGELLRLMRAVQAKERERCAELCETNSTRWDEIGGDGAAPDIEVTSAA